MGLILVTPPSQHLLSLEDAKRHLRVDHNDDDLLIGDYIAAAESLLDGRDGLLQRALAPQTWALELGCFPCGVIDIPLPPLRDVLAVRYLTPASAWADMAPVEWDVAREPGGAKLAARDGWPETGEGLVTVRVEFAAGYRLPEESDSDLEPAPAQLIQLLRLLVGGSYANREPVIVGAGVAEMPLACRTLIANLRVYR